MYLLCSREDRKPCGFVITWETSCIYIITYLYYKPVVFEVFKAENVQQTNRKSDVFGVIRRWFENGTVDFLHNPHKHFSIDGLHTERWWQLYTGVYSIWHQTVKPTFSFYNLYKGVSASHCLCWSQRFRHTLPVGHQRAPCQAHIQGIWGHLQKKNQIYGLECAAQRQNCFQNWTLITSNNWAAILKCGEERTSQPSWLLIMVSWKMKM